MAYVDKIFDRNFLEYASYVIKERAIPDLRDGLKPVQRRILHSLFEMDDGKFHKVANVVGHCMKYHPHGDASIYEALVQLAQRELLIDTQGNFGNIFTGDEASAARYIECRINAFAREVLYNPDITVYVDSYDGRNREPLFFPAKIPLVLLLGVDGIAVGMRTLILPHNFVEVMRAIQEALRGKEVTLYPDFPQGGTIDVSDYRDGLGKVVVRAVLDTKDPKRIVVRELPYGVSTRDLIDSIEKAVEAGKVKVAQINDYTADRVEVEITLPKGVTAEDVVGSLYAHTKCQVSYSTELLVIKDDKPVQMTVTEVVRYHADHLVGVLRAELEREEADLNDRLHARTLERIFIEERLYKKIEEKKTEEEVFFAVIEGFEPFRKEIRRQVTREEVERLLKIPIRRISLYDMNKLRQEIREIEDRLAQIRSQLADMVGYTIGWIDGLLERNQDRFPRRTRVESFEKIKRTKAVIRGLKLRYDAQSGYLGLAVTGGRIVAEVSREDKVLVIDASGSYRVYRVQDRTYVGKNALWVGLADRETLAATVFSLAYLSPKDGKVYIKRFVIDSWILDRVYPLVPKAAKILAFTDRQDLHVAYQVVVRGKTRPGEDRPALNEFLIKNPSAQGRRLTHLEVASVAFVEEG